MSDEPRLAIATRKRGRPRKHESATARVRAFREARSLCKVTVDVPAQYAEQLRAYARLLRVTARAERPSRAEVSRESGQHFEAELPSIFPFGHAELYRPINAGRMDHPAVWRAHRFVVEKPSVFYQPTSFRRPRIEDQYAKNFYASVAVARLGGYTWIVRPKRDRRLILGRGRVPSIAAALILAECTMLTHLTSEDSSTQPVQTP
jgi:hypothetical protein